MARKAEIQKDSTGFGPPLIAAAVDPRVAAYQQDAEKRQREKASANALPKYNESVGYGKMPIPPLDMPHQEGMSMADHANAMRQPPPQQQGIIQPSQQPTSQGPALLNSDLLPEEAIKDPLFRDGAGARYAINQSPQLAAKYGVLRGGKRIPPQTLTQGRPGLSAQTVAGLEEVKKFNQQRQREESGEGQIEREAAQGPAGAAARLANGPGGDGNVETSSSEDIKQRIASMDDFDFNALRQALMKDLLNNDEQRKIVEERLQELDLTELIIHGFIRQNVVIVPGKFEVEFQSMSGDEDLALKRLAMEESKSVSITQQYILDKFSAMSVALGISSINKNPLPPHVDPQGNFSDDLFAKKFSKVMRLPFHMIASMGVNYFWFDIRVRKLFVAEKIKNG